MGQPSLFQRILFFPRYAKQEYHPEFYGPNRASLKFAIGPIFPIPSQEQQMKNLEKIAAQYGHEVITTEEIQVRGKRHATMTCKIQKLGNVKNYSLIFGGIEYFVTARGNFEVCDSIIRTFKCGK